MNALQVIVLSASVVIGLCIWLLLVKWPSTAKEKAKVQAKVDNTHVSVEDWLEALDRDAAVSAAKANATVHVRYGERPAGTKIAREAAKGLIGKSRVR